METSRTKRRPGQLTKRAEEQQQKKETPITGSCAILPDAIYPMSDFMRMTGKGRYAMREARKRGLPVIRDGRCVLVRGADYFRYLEEINADGNNNSPRE